MSKIKLSLIKANNQIIQLAEIIIKTDDELVDRWIKREIQNVVGKINSHPGKTDTLVIKMTTHRRA